MRVAVHVRYAWRSQPLPSGRTSVIAPYSFSLAPDLEGERINMKLRAPVRIEGEPVEYPSPQALADAALADPEVREWVDSRWKNAAFQLNVDGIFPTDGTWADLDFEGGPAPLETIEIEAQAGGTVRSLLRSLRIDPWAATVEYVGLVDY
ncbi:MAG: hypothetical protein ACC726_17460 [Chloroflexota bacterium]